MAALLIFMALLEAQGTWARPPTLSEPILLLIVLLVTTQLCQCLDLKPECYNLFLRIVLTHFLPLSLEFVVFSVSLSLFSLYHHR